MYLFQTSFYDFFSKVIIIYFQKGKTVKTFCDWKYFWRFFEKKGVSGKPKGELSSKYFKSFFKQILLLSKTIAEWL